MVDQSGIWREIHEESCWLVLHMLFGMEAQGCFITRASFLRGKVRAKSSITGKRWPKTHSVYFTILSSSDPTFANVYPFTLVSNSVWMSVILKIISLKKSDLTLSDTVHRCTHQNSFRHKYMRPMHKKQKTLMCSCLNKRGEIYFSLITWCPEVGSSRDGLRAQCCRYSRWVPLHSLGPRRPMVQSC